MFQNLYWIHFNKEFLQLNSEILWKKALCLLWTGYISHFIASQTHALLALMEDPAFLSDEKLFGF